MSLGSHSGLMARLLGWLKDALTGNLPLKALSLILALGLTAYQRGAQEEQQRTVPVDVIVRMPGAEAHRELMTLVPPNVHVTVRGSTRALDQLIQSGVPPVEVDLRTGDVGRIVFDDTMFSMPPGVKVNIIDPASIDLDWENVISRNVPIQAAMTGHVAEGYTVESVEVVPATIVVQGPASLVEVKQFVRLAAFDVSGKTDGVYRHPLALDPPGQRMSYRGPASATVTVKITRQLIQRKLAKQAIVVVGSARAKTEPRTVDVTVTGPPEAINGLRDEMVVPRVDLNAAGVDLKEQRHGSIVLNVRVDLANAEIQIQPPTVKVTW
jgi:YbbR domain-containing protein